MSLRRFLSLVLLLALAGWLCPDLHAQPPGDKGGDLLDQVRRLNELKARKPKRTCAMRFAKPIVSAEAIRLRPSASSKQHS